MPLHAKGCRQVRESSCPDHKLELGMNVTTSNETCELNLDELNLVSGGGLFSFALTLGGFGPLATVYQRAGGRDVNVSLGVKPAY